MKKISLILSMLAVVGTAGSAFAATATSNITVSANVAATCKIDSVANVAFGAYDPTLATDNTAGAGNFVFRCTKGTPYQYYITGVRTMTGAPTPDSLNFELYSDAARTTVFPSTNPGITTGSPAANNALVTVDVYGTIPQLQDVSVGAYTKTVVVTVEY